MAAAKTDGGAAEHVDIYADLNTEECGDAMEAEAEADALYDDVLTGSVDSEGVLGKQSDEDGKAAVEFVGGGRFSVYIGNFNWWTSDNDLMTMARKQGVKDVIEIKFAENRTNGQSKGYAEIVVSTEESLRRLLETLPQCKINGEKVECRHVSRKNLAEFEALARKRIPLRLNPKSDSERAEGRNSSASSPSDLPPLPLPLAFPPVKPPPLMPPFYNTPPPPLPPPPLFSTPPPLFHPPSHHAQIPNTHHIPNTHIHHAHIPNTHMPNAHILNAHTHNTHTHTPSLHINPAFFPPNPAARLGTTTSSGSRARFSQPGDADFEELINRNRTIASSAITKAISAATSGDIRMAIETLYTATAVIKQSRVFFDKRCRVLVESLNDCLNSVETKCFPSRDTVLGSERGAERGADQGTDIESAHPAQTETESGSEAVIVSTETGIDGTFATISSPWLKISRDHSAYEEDQLEATIDLLNIAFSASNNLFHGISVNFLKDAVLFVVYMVMNRN
ncbi:cleavage and polyadenylation specificity factor subunit 6 isoform X3 [Silurus asotus]|uniref:Cleavage and polyadenylation specificity factor subunit 6 isoform X3 n=1 Tax=Silurus asotus TaxID=30991 RepID=A0AAD5A129_SILAS|nr:cleavage and polyadenylation specificity factor subunit 6 isoform X3 [Silurus asotus]